MVIEYQLNFGNYWSLKLILKRIAKYLLFYTVKQINRQLKYFYK